MGQCTDTRQSARVGLVPEAKDSNPCVFIVIASLRAISLPSLLLLTEISRGNYYSPTTALRTRHRRDQEHLLSPEGRRSCSIYDIFVNSGHAQDAYDIPWSGPLVSS